MPATADVDLFVRFLGNTKQFRVAIDRCAERMQREVAEMRAKRLLRVRGQALLIAKHQHLVREKRRLDCSERRRRHRPAQVHAPHLRADAGRHRRNGQCRACVHRL